MSRGPRHFLDLWRLDAADLRAILDDAHARKAARKGWPQGPRRRRRAGRGPRRWR